MVSANIRTVTLALVGTGRWGANYIKTISELPNCKLPSQYIVTRNYKQLASKTDIDGVIIATPPDTHFEISSFFLKHGKNILVEKPATTRYIDAKKLLSLQNKNNKIVMVGHIYEYHPGIVNLIKNVGMWKNIQYIYSEGVGNGPVRSDINALWDWAPHDIGICLRIVKEIPTFVSCWEQAKDSLYFLKLVFPSGVVSVSRVGWLSPERKRSVLVMGNKKSFYFDDSDSKVSFDKSPLTIEIETFIKAIQKNTPPPTDLLYGAKIVRIIKAAEKSVKLRGKMIQL